VVAWWKDVQKRVLDAPSGCFPKVLASGILLQGTNSWSLGPKCGKGKHVGGRNGTVVMEQCGQEPCTYKTGREYGGKH
jgi:hypothetical protein